MVSVGSVGSVVGVADGGADGVADGGSEEGAEGDGVAGVSVGVSVGVPVGVSVGVSVGIASVGVPDVAGVDVGRSPNIASASTVLRSGPTVASTASRARSRVHCPYVDVTRSAAPTGTTCTMVAPVPGSPSKL